MKILAIISIVILIGINAFFVATEFAIVSVRRSRINQLVAAGNLPAKTVQKIQRDMERLLSTTQIGITLSSLALGWIGENTIGNLLHEWILKLPFKQEISTQISHYIAIPTAFCFIAYLQIVLGELCPKAIALLYREQISGYLGTPSIAIARFFQPLIWILTQSTRYLLKLVGIDYTGQFYSYLTWEELQIIITEKETTKLDSEQRQFLKNVFQFQDVLVSEVMVTRNNIKGISSTANLQDLFTKMDKYGYKCYPVTGDSLDDIKGMISVKELIPILATGNIDINSLIETWMIPVRFIPEFTSLSELLSMMQKDKLSMVIVVDEFGSTVGLITLNDLIAEIIGGDNQSENQQQLTIQKIDHNTFIIQAQINIEEVNQILNINLPLIPEYQTLGGFILYQFQKIPQQGEIMHFDNLEITVISCENRRLDQVQISINN